ncbi:MAG: nucleoside triphosphate hydrolase [Hoeflea sp.]|uniref:nucleoside triphosphate hydrolase n=1 Tax=Hoeflea sp. TaxID=1940281 RepID=UPI003EF12CB2
MKLEHNAAQLVQVAIARAAKSQRFVIALAGPPGVGKSTLSEALVGEFNHRDEGAAIVPMDGFHLDNAVLETQGTLARKGAPFTFDADGYAALLTRLRAEPDQDIAVPVFDRELDLARAGGAIITPRHRFLIAEGNYLLLGDPGWTQMAGLFDLTIMLTADMEVLTSRLIDRWLGYGLNPEQARKRALSNDIPNAELVLRKSNKADVEISSDS